MKEKSSIARYRGGFINMCVSYNPILVLTTFSHISLVGNVGDVGEQSSSVHIVGSPARGTGTSMVK